MTQGGASKNYIDKSIAHSLHLDIKPTLLEVGFAQSSVKRQAFGVCHTDICINNRVYKSIELFVLDNLCCQMLLGIDFQQMFKRIVFELNGPENDLIIKGKPSPVEGFCAVAQADLQCPPLFANLTKDCKPIATKSRRYSKDDSEFIEREVHTWLKDGVCRPSNSPWRAQIVLVKDPVTGKRRICIDYLH